MSTGKNHRGPAPAAPSKLADIEAKLIAFLQTAKSYLAHAGVTVGVILVIIFATAHFKTQKRIKIAGAYAELHSALALIDKVNPDATDSEVAEIVGRLKNIIETSAAVAVVPEAKFQLGSVYFKLGQYKKAEAQFAEFLSEYPEYPPLTTMALMARGNCYFSDGRYKQANELFELIASDQKVLEDNPVVTAQAKFNSALCHLFLAQYEVAKEKLNDILAGDNSKAIEEKAQSLLGKFEIFSPEELMETLTISKVSE